MIQIDGKSQPERGDVVEAWIKSVRDAWKTEHYVPGANEKWKAYDDLLDEYRMRADYGIPLEEDLPAEAGMM